MRKLSVFFVSFLAIAVMAFAGCGGNGGQDPKLLVGVDKTELIFDQLGQSEVITPSDGDRELLGATWSIDKPSVASVNRGVVVALADGKAEITCKYGDQEIKIAVTVATDFSVTLDKNAYEIAEVGGKITLSPTVKLPTIFDTVKKVNYTSSKTNVATVADNGEVTAVGEGVTMITLTTEVKKTVESVNMMTGKKTVTTAPATTNIMVAVGNEFDKTTHAELLGGYVGTYDWQGFVKAKSDAFKFTEANRTWIRANSELTLKDDGTFTHMIINAMRKGYKGVIGEDNEYDKEDRVYNNVAGEAFVDGDKEFAQMPAFAMKNLSNSGIIFIKGGNVTLYCLGMGGMGSVSSVSLLERDLGDISGGLTVFNFKPFDASVKADIMTIELTKKA